MREISVPGDNHAAVVRLEGKPVRHIVVAEHEPRGFLWRGWIGDVETHHRAPRRDRHQIVVPRDYWHRAVCIWFPRKRRHELSRRRWPVQSVQQIKAARK